MPPLSFDRPLAMRMFLVSAFLPEMTQQIHSFLASGMMSFHTLRAAGVALSARFKSSGILCTVPLVTYFAGMIIVIRSGSSRAFFPAPAIQL